MNKTRKYLIDATLTRPASSAANHTRGGVKFDQSAVRARQEERRARAAAKRDPAFDAEAVFLSHPCRSMQF